MKLLTGPLYGDLPEVGIRELMQNAIDAVLECHEYRKRHPELVDVKFVEQETEIVISLAKDDDGWWLTVSDQGIGMTLDTIQNYFLKVGASLRRSEIWKKEFENEKGKSRICRAGRFGIGILAAFLLGDKVEVTTRFISESSKNGFSFCVGLDSEMIELTHIERPVGTTIRIGINKKTKDELLGEWDKKRREWSNQEKWDWYCLQNPQICRVVKYNSIKQILLQKFWLPNCASTSLPSGYYRISHPDYQDIQWTLNDVPDIVVNGIKVSGNSFVKLWSGDFYEIKSPKLSIFDKDAIFPIMLNRSGMSQRKYPFHELLLEDVIKDIIAFCFVNTPPQTNELDDLFDWCSHYNYSGFFGFADIWNPWFFTKSGISFARDYWYVNQIDLKCALLLPDNISFYKPEILSDFIFAGASYAVFLNSFYEFESFRSDYSKREHMEELTKYIKISLGLIYELKSLDELFFGKRILVSKYIMREIDDVSLWDQRELLDSEIFKEYKKEWENENWILWQIGNTSSAAFDFKKFAAENNGHDYDEWPCIIAEWYLKDKSERPEIDKSPLAKAWEEYVESPVMPFDLEERKKLKGYEILKPFIETHEYLRRYRKENGGLW